MAVIGWQLADPLSHPQAPMPLTSVGWLGRTELDAMRQQHQIAEDALKAELRDQLSVVPRNYDHFRSNTRSDFYKG